MNTKWVINIVCSRKDNTWADINFHMDNQKVNCMIAYLQCAMFVLPATYIIAEIVRWLSKVNHPKRKIDVVESLQSLTSSNYPQFQWSETCNCIINTRPTTADRWPLTDDRRPTIDDRRPPTTPSPSHAWEVKTRPDIRHLVASFWGQERWSSLVFYDLC